MDEEPALSAPEQWKEVQVDTDPPCELLVYATHSWHVIGLLTTIDLQHFDIKRLQESINWFNAMSYSMHSTWDQNNTWVGPFLNPHTNLTEIKGALDLIWRNDIKPAKVTMGLAYYSRSFTLSSPDCFEPGCTYKSGGNAGQCSSTVGFLLNSEIQTIINENGLTPRFYEEDAVKAIHWVTSGCRMRTQTPSRSAAILQNRSARGP